MSSCLIVMNWRQRLLQVGTCVISRNRTLWGRRFQDFQQQLQPGDGGGGASNTRVMTPVPSIGHPGGHSSRSIATLTSRGGPLLSSDGGGGMPGRRRRVVSRGAQFPLLEDGGAGMRKVTADDLEEEFDTQLGQQDSGRPVITVPVHLEKRLERRMERESTKRAERQRILDGSREGRKSNIVIHCKRPEFNHYKGQSYSRKPEEVTLASRGWAHHKSSDDFFTLFPGFKRESPFFMPDGEAPSFADLGLCEQLCENLTKLGIEQPTHIQMFGIPQILKGKRTVVAAETGCGKTLVYLLPIINQHLEDKRHRVRAKPGQPSSVILAPSRELADQIYEVALQLTYNLDIKVKLLQGGRLALKAQNPSTSTVDILVTTTNAVKVLSSAGIFGLSRILHVVLDEADTLLDDSFFPELVGPFLNRLPWDDLKRDIQLTLVSATMPKDLQSTLGQIMKIDNFYDCTTPGLHSLLPHVPQTFLRVKKSQKSVKIREMIKRDFENKVPVIIFCNRSKTCDWLSQYLNDEGYDCASVHGRMPLKYRAGRVDMYKRGELNVLICTDLASRGIDTVRTQHVINYEFPLYVADYIHRCGRTGRVGSQRGCRVTNFISRSGEIAAVNEIELSVRKDKSLNSVDANIKRLYGQHYGEFVEIQPINDEDGKDKINEEEESDDEDESEEKEYSRVDNERRLN